MCKKCYYTYEKFADKKEVLHFTNSSRSKITCFKTQNVVAIIIFF